MTYKQQYPFNGQWVCGAAEVPQLLLIKDAGIVGIREDITWATTEPTKGSYDFSRIDKIMSITQQAGLRLWVILDYGNPLYGGTPITSTARTAFKNYAVALVKRYKQRGIIWEIQNEPDDSTNLPGLTPYLYSQLVNTTVNGIRSISKDEWIIAGGVSSWDTNGGIGVPNPYLTSAIEAGLNVDAITPHGYRHSDPNTIVADLQALNVLLRKAGSTAFIGIGEWGYEHGWLNNPDDVMFEKLQMEAYSKMIQISKNYGYPLAIFNIQDGFNTKYPYGLLKPDGTAKSLLSTVKLAITAPSGSIV
jgi:hypothetical protein